MLCRYFVFKTFVLNNNIHLDLYWKGQFYFSLCAREASPSAYQTSSHQNRTST